MIDLDRLEKANKVLSTMKLLRVTLIAKSNRVAVQWFFPSYMKKPVSKVWVTGGSDHYPTWDYGQAGMGGTGCGALAQLIRWAQHKPVFGMSVWKYWAGEDIKLCEQDTLDMLKEVGYQEENICVLCNQNTRGLDWWRMNDKSGPCCSFGRCEDDCKLARKAEQEKARLESEKLENDRRRYGVSA